MRALSLGLNELRRFRKPLQRGGLIFLVLVPLIYGGIYLWSQWDPYGKLDQVPVAVVNQDRPVTVEGKRVDGGQIFVDQLERKPLFQWHYVGERAALEGQRNGDYYMVITVPPDFSRNLASGETRTPQKARMGIRLDDANGYLAGKMAETLQSELERQMNAAAVAAYFKSVFTGAEELRHGLHQAGAGAERLGDGLDEEKKGTGELVAGLTKLKAGTSRLVPGAAEVAAGVHRLTGVLIPLVDTVAAILPDLQRGAADLARKASDLENAARNLPDISDISASYDEACDAIMQVHGTDHPAYRGMYSALIEKAQLKCENAREIDTGGGAGTDVTGLARQLRDDANGLARMSARAQRDAPELENRLEQASDELTKLDNGAQEVAAGAKEVDGGAGQALAGATKLDSGTAKLRKGAADLSDALNKGAGQIPDLSKTEGADLASALASPVQVGRHNAHPAGEYGRGLAPFFFPVALWVFGTVAFFLLRPIVGRLLAGRIGDITLMLASWLPVLLAGLTAALVLFVVVDIGLGLDPLNVLGTVGLMFLGMATFTALQQMLRMLLGPVGSPIALVLLIVQLVSGGGLYPVETLSQPFRALHYVLPMSYLVDALRVTISGGNPDHTWRAVAVLAAYLIGALLVMVLAARIKRTWTMARLKPQLSL